MLDADIQAEEHVTKVRYKMGCNHYVLNMSPRRIPRGMLKFAPHGKRNVGQPRL